jgi:hypothetical protein
MKIFRFSFFMLSGLVFLVAGCGKPNDPDSNHPNYSGYRIVQVFRTSGYAQDLVKENHFMYVAQGEGGLLIADATDPLNPQVVSVTTNNVRGYSTNIVKKDSVVYLAAGTFGVTTVDVANPDNPIVTVSNLNMKPARGLHVMGEYLFAAVSEQGVVIADISYPTQPDIRGGFATPGYARGLATTPDSSLLLVACGEMGLTLFDISDFQNGYGPFPKVGWVDTPGYAEEVVLKNDQPIAFVACGSAGLQIIDFADTTNLLITGSFFQRGYAKDILYQNNKIYLAVRSFGVQVIDVTNVKNPVLIAEIPTKYAIGLAIDEHYLYIADEAEGIIIISIP